MQPNTLIINCFNFLEMRKQLLGLVFAFVALVGNWGNAYATTTDDLVASGWNLVTEITDVENNYYLFVDAGTSAYMMAHTGTWEKAYYDALEDPILSSGALWILEGNEGATSYALKNATTERYFNSGSAGWNNYTSATNDNANYTLTLADGKYSVVSVTTNQYLGPWNNNGAVAGDGENIAANKSATGAPGFYLYSMSRTDFETKKAEWTCEVSEENPLDLTSLIINPNFDNGTTNGWISNTGAQNNKIANNQSGDITGYFYENWNGSSYTGTIEQTITNLPNGVYSVTIAAFRQDAVTGVDQDAVYVFGNDQSTLVTATTGTYYTVENVKVLDGTLRLGIESTVANYKWMGIDNASIAMTGAISDEEMETLLAAKETLAAAEVLNRVIAKKIGINNILNDAQCAANIEEAAILYNDAISDPTSVAAEDINAMIATLWADLDDYTANVLNGEFESELENWTQVAGTQFFDYGVASYGSDTEVTNVGKAPATDIIGHTGNNALAMSVRWAEKISFTQELTLPAGKHVVTFDAYNANASVAVGENFTSLTGVIVGENTYTSNVASYKANVWVSEAIEFEMTEAGTVTLTVGYAIPDAGTNAVPKLWIDNVKVYSTNVHRRANAEDGKYGTICLPFNAELPENMLLYSVAGVDSKDAPTTLYLNKETSLQAGVAYIYYSLDANDIMLQKSDVAELLDAPEASSNGLTGTFVGAIPTTETTFTGEHYYLLSQNKWVKVKSEYAGQVGVKRFRAYLDVQQIADENTGTEVVSYARSMNIGGGGANGIEEILNSLNGGDDLFYTVGGQRVSAPVKGLYIKNGKKIIVK